MNFVFELRYLPLLIGSIFKCVFSNVYYTAIEMMKDPVKRKLKAKKLRIGDESARNAVERMQT